jgi:vancomycin resistance protein YoaR
MRRCLLFLSLLASPAFSATLLADFSCVRPRAVDEGTWHNVSLAASLVDGVVVAAGQEFSFLKEMVPKEGHFEPGNTLFAGRVVKSIGGGYCQVSTSIYNAVLLAGLPVVERYSHSFFDAEDAYVEPGLDAAVSGTNHADFRFFNSTHSDLTLHVVAQDGRVAVQIFGNASPRKRWVTIEKTEIPMRHLQREGTQPRPGYNGWEVRRTLNVLDAEGNTRSIFLGTDHYDMVTEYD